MDIRTIAREGAAVVATYVAVNATVKAADDLLDIVRKVINVAAEKIGVSYLCESALDRLPESWPGKIKKGFSTLTQNAFSDSVGVRLSTKTAKQLGQKIASAFLISVIAYKVASSSCLVNGAVRCLSQATCAVAARIP
ncbi:MAG: hypothetical protein LVR00_03460 [Rhabdochlamydiaceae bacterium]|jgi:hypothetical protein